MFQTTRLKFFHFYFIFQSHENLDIYRKAFDIIERYFGSEEDDSRIAPTVDAQGQQFEFNPALATAHQVKGMFIIFSVRQDFLAVTL